MATTRGVSGASADSMLTIGEVATRSGLAVSAIRFYADTGLIRAERSPAGHRRFERSTLRRVAFIQTCQRLGYPLERIAELLDGLPSGRTPTESDWSAMAEDFVGEIDDRIAELVRLRDSLDSCIGCGCLSLQRCAIWNPEDRASRLGVGPRYLRGDSAADLPG